MTIYLRALELEDYKLINKWRNDDDIQRLTAGHKYFVSSEMEKKWVEAKISNDTVNLYLAICTVDDGAMVGYLSLNNIDLRNRRVEWGGIIIGEKSIHNKGVATRAANLMLEYAFSELGVHKVYAYWLDEHKSSIALGKKLGFKEEGLMREHVFKKNAFWDVKIMSILKEEFSELNG